MRHGDKVNNLGRTTAHRKALLNNLAAQLIQHKRITTTLAKAKALRVFVEPLITRSKNDTTHNRRIVFSHLQNKESIKELFSVVSEKVAGRPGGYTRIIKLAPRMGDAAEMALIELVDFNTTYNVSEKTAAKKTRRSRGAAKKEAPAAATTTEEATPAVEEAPKADNEATNEATKPEGAE